MKRLPSACHLLPCSWNVSDTGHLFAAAPGALEGAAFPTARQLGGSAVRLYRIHTQPGPTHSAECSGAVSANAASTAAPSATAALALPPVARATAAWAPGAPRLPSSTSTCLPNTAISAPNADGFFAAPHSGWSQHTQPQRLRASASLRLPRALASTLTDLLGLSTPDLCHGVAWSSPPSSSAPTSTSSTSASPPSHTVTVKAPAASSGCGLRLRHRRSSYGATAGGGGGTLCLQLVCGGRGRESTRVRSASATPGGPTIPEGAALHQDQPAPAALAAAAAAAGPGSAAGTSPLRALSAASGAAAAAAVPAAEQSCTRRPPTLLVALSSCGGHGRQEPVLVAATLRKVTIRGASGGNAAGVAAASVPTHAQPATPNVAHEGHSDSAFPAMPAAASAAFVSAAGVHTVAATGTGSSSQAPVQPHGPGRSGYDRRCVRVWLRLHDLASVAPAATTTAAAASSGESESLNGEAAGERQQQRQQQQQQQQPEEGPWVTGYDVFVSVGGRHVLLLLHTAATPAEAAAHAAAAATAATCSTAKAAAAAPSAATPVASQDPAVSVASGEEGEPMAAQGQGPAGRGHMPGGNVDTASEDEAMPDWSAPPLPHQLQLRMALSSPPSFSGWGSVTTSGPAAAAAAPAPAGAAASGLALPALVVGVKRLSDPDGAVTHDGAARRQRAFPRDPSASGADAGSIRSGGFGPISGGGPALDEGLCLSPLPSPAHDHDAAAEAAADASAAAGPMGMDTAIGHIGAAGGAGDRGAEGVVGGAKGSRSGHDSGASGCDECAVMRSPRSVAEAALLGVAAIHSAQAEAEELRAELEAARRAQRAAEGTVDRLRGELRTRVSMERCALKRIEEILESQHAALREAQARAREAGEAAELMRAQLAAEVAARGAAERRVWDFRALAERAMQI